MKKIINFLRKFGVIHISSGDYITGEFDARKDFKKGSKNKNSKLKGLFMFRFVLVVGILFTIFALLVLEFSFSFFVVFAIWFWFIFSIKKSLGTGAFVLKSTITFFIIIFIVSFVIVIIGTPSDGGSSGALTGRSICKANNLSKKINDRVSVNIVDNDDVFLNKTKASYSLEELGSLSYGHDVEEVKKGEYVLAEVCAGEDGLSSMLLEADEGLFYQNDDDYPSMGGNYTQFVNGQSDGTFVKTIKTPGVYMIYAYASTDGNKWYIAQEFEIVVK